MSSDESVQKSPILAWICFFFTMVTLLAAVILRLQFAAYTQSNIVAVSAYLFLGVLITTVLIYILTNGVKCLLMTIASLLAIAVFYTLPLFLKQDNVSLGVDSYDAEQMTYIDSAEEGSPSRTTESANAAILTMPNTDLLNRKPNQEELFETAKQLTAVVQGTMNIRSGPSTDYEKIGSLEFGSVVYAFAVADNWYLVEYGENASGWASGKLVFAAWMFEDSADGFFDGIAAPTEFYASPYLAKVTQSGETFLRVRYSDDSRSLKTLNQGDRVAVIGYMQDWVFVNNKGTYGWIDSNSISD